MSEFCAGVKILLERMKSNPEDFEMVEFDMATDQGVQGRFYQFAQSMDDVILGKQNKDRPWRDWQYFTDEERQALIGGFKEMKRANFDKHIMERVFDEHYIERQQERIRRQYQNTNTSNLQNSVLAQQARGLVGAQMGSQALGMVGMGLGVGGAGGAGVFK
jgi:hypothetical protein